ncbi:hypothetical protein GOODEAATRI_017359, partial [Goodea atripinnis]
LEVDIYSQLICMSVNSLLSFWFAGVRLHQSREGSSPLTPMMRALIELEETKATETRAPCKHHIHTSSQGSSRRF